MTDSKGTLPHNETLAIGEVARRFGVSVDTIREWEKVGKINSFRTLGNQRRFNLSDNPALAALISPSTVTSPDKIILP